MRWTGPVALLMMLLPGAALAQDFKVETPHVDSIQIYEYGLYQTRSAEKIKDPKATGGERGTVVNIDLVGVTTTIPAELEMEFGIRYLVEGGPEGAEVPVTIVMRFPQPGLKEPGKSKPTLENRQVTVGTVGYAGHYQSYGFDYPWEIVPGVWTFELWAEGRKMAEQKFNIVR